jgi:hypothetical protein
MNVRTLLLAAAAVLVAGTANAATIVGLYSTGVDNSGVAVSGNGADLHWTLNGGSAFTGATNGQFPIGPWVADTAASRWLTPTPNAADSFDPTTDGAYDYTLTFNLTAAQAAGASFTGQFAADNTVTAIMLNGHDLGSGGGFSSWTGFDAAAPDFKAGQNTLTFDVDNFAQNGGNPTGLNVQFLTSTAGAVPEPATWSIMLVGFGGLGAALRASRRRRLAV